MGALQGRVAVVTGSDAGSGRAIAEAYAAEGADVAVTWHADAAGAEQTRRRVEAAGRRALAHRLDVADPASVHALFGAVRATLGTAFVLVKDRGVSGPAR